ncbi:guanylate kinase [Anaerofustis sp.]|uniref:guanylate kinase n=1 Tax=Anaerofustis sp. TaxID=1872517 RepID=UPI0025C13A2E|nr:guanylate kinase [Anaerofustis sp.]
MKGSLFVISGPSGSGKSTICKELEKEENIKISISATTRDIRNGEEEGINYYFLSKEEFERKISENAFYEYAKVFNNYYGTLKDKVDEMLKDGYNVILEIDVQGAMQIREQNKDAVLIFIMPPSEEELIKRLTGRNTESEEQLKLRIETAKEEISYKDKYDYVVINDNLEKAVEEIKEIILK